MILIIIIIEIIKKKILKNIQITNRNNKNKHAQEIIIYTENKKINKIRIQINLIKIHHNNNKIKVKKKYKIQKISNNKINIFNQINSINKN